MLISGPRPMPAGSTRPVDTRMNCIGSPSMTRAPSPPETTNSSSPPRRMVAGTAPSPVSTSEMCDTDGASPSLVVIDRPSAGRISSAGRYVSNHSASSPAPSVCPFPCGPSALKASSSKASASPAAAFVLVRSSSSSSAAVRPRRSSTWRAVTSGVPSPSRRNAVTSLSWPTTCAATSATRQPSQRLGVSHCSGERSLRRSANAAYSVSIPGTTTDRASVIVSSLAWPRRIACGVHVTYMHTACMVKRQSTPRQTQAERSEATRAALLTAARELFAEHGYGGASSEAIVAAAGVSRGALQHHFVDKRSLFAAVYEEVEREVVLATAEAGMAAGHDDPLGVLQAGGHRCLPAGGG